MAKKARFPAKSARWFQERAMVSRAPDGIKSVPRLYAAANPAAVAATAVPSGRVRIARIPG